MRHDFDQIIERKGTDSIKWSAFAEEILPMWVADSDFACPQPIVDALAGRVQHKIFGYANLDKAIEEASLHWLSTRFGWKDEKAGVAFAPGVCSAIAMMINRFTQPGDSIVTFTPSYPPLLRLPVLNGRVSLPCALEPQSWAVNYADLESKLSQPRTTMLLLCNPHNPTGKVFTREELMRIGELCLKHNVLIVADEIHCDYVFNGKHIPLPSLPEEISNNCLATINPSKTFNIAGLHTAAVYSTNSNLLSLYKETVTAGAFHATSLGAIAFHTAYTECAYYADQVLEYVKDNVEFAVDYLNKNARGIKAYVPQSTYLLWLDCTELGMDDDALGDFLKQKAKVALNPGPPFGAEGHGFTRLNCACPRTVLEEGLKRIASATK